MKSWALAVGLGAVVVAEAAGAATYHFELSPARELSAEVRTESVATVPPPNPAPSMLLSAGPSFSLLSGASGFGLSLSALFRVVNPVYVGLETGYFSWSGSGYSSFSGPVSASLSAVPVLASALYRHALRPDLGLYGGLSLGFAIASADASGFGMTFQGSGALFQIHVRPGIEYAVSSTVALFFETKLGLLGSAFLFAPQLGVTVAL